MRNPFPMTEICLNQMPNIRNAVRLLDVGVSVGCGNHLITNRVAHILTSEPRKLMSVISKSMEPVKIVIQFLSSVRNE
jgi:hypothetical protein